MAKKHQNESPTVVFTRTAQNLLCPKHIHRITQLVADSGLGHDTKVTIRTKTEGAGVETIKRYTVQVVDCNPKRHNRIPLLVSAIGEAIGQKTMEYTATTGSKDKKPKPGRR